MVSVRLRRVIGIVATAVERIFGGSGREWAWRSSTMVTARSECQIDACYDGHQRTPHVAHTTCAS